MITQRAWLVGVVGFCFYLITIVNNLPSFFYALTWLAAGVLGSSLGIAFLSLIGLRCAWRVPREIVSENYSDDAGGPSIEVQLANAGTLNKTGALLEVRLERINDGRQFSQKFLLEALPSGTSISTSLPLRHLRRGRYKALELHLIGSDVLGLFSVRKRAVYNPDFDSVFSKAKRRTDDEPTETEELVIGPAALLHTNAPLTSDMRAVGENGVPLARYMGQGEDIRGTRLYAPGDDLRHVHWKSTARKGQLVVKEFHHVLQEQSLVVWDGSAPVKEDKPKRNRKSEKKQAAHKDEENGRFDVGFNAEEWSLRLAASVCRSLIENKRPCLLLRLDSSPQLLGTEGGGLSLNQVASALAAANADRTRSFTEAFAPFRARWQGGEIYIVTTNPTPQLAELIKQLTIAGMRVTVGVVDRAAFATPPQLHTPEYDAGLRALLKVGAHLVTLTPQKDSRNFVGPLLLATRSMLEHRATRTPGGTREAAAPSLVEVI
jgi:uncharacterized protein (DUF58 family)